MDQNKDGVVCRKDFQRLFENMGEEVKAEQIDELIQFANTSGTGNVTFEEFCNAINSGMSLRQVFEVLD